MNREKVVALHSGGMDSTALLYHLRDANYDVYPLCIHYGQRHRRELEYAGVIATRGSFPTVFVDLGGLQPILKGSSQTEGGIAVPEGHYSEDNMAVTVVPNRNMILLSSAVAYAISIQAEFVAYAAHQGDHAQYPDCRQDFIDALAKAIALCDYAPPKLMAPYAKMTKAEIVTDGDSHKTPFDITWSCYKGESLHCGRCGTCVERAEAFFLAGVKDPTVYQDPYYWKSVTKIQA